MFLLYNKYPKKSIFFQKNVNFFENWGIDKTHNILYNSTNKKRRNEKMKKFESLKKFKSNVVKRTKEVAANAIFFLADLLEVRKL